MPLDELLEWIPQGDPAAALARQVAYDRLPAHVAIIMDGNGRWAAQRHLPRQRGVGIPGGNPRQQFIERHGKVLEETST